MPAASSTIRGRTRILADVGAKLEYDDTAVGAAVRRIHVHLATIGSRLRRPAAFGGGPASHSSDFLTKRATTWPTQQTSAGALEISELRVPLPNSKLVIGDMPDHGRPSGSLDSSNCGKTTQVPRLLMTETHR
jgi:hypothetical protein